MTSTRPLLILTAFSIDLPRSIAHPPRFDECQWIAELPFKDGTAQSTPESPCSRHQTGLAPNRCAEIRREGRRDTGPQERFGTAVGERRPAIRAEFFGLSAAGQCGVLLFRGSQVLPSWRAVLRAGVGDRQGRKKRAPVDRHARQNLSAGQGGGSAQSFEGAALRAAGGACD